MAKKVWNFFIPLTTSLYRLNRDQWSPYDYWEWMSKNVRDEELELAILILWQIWTHRNMILHNAILPDHNSVIRGIEVKRDEGLTHKASKSEEW